MNEDKMITYVRITEMPKGLFDPMPQVFVKLKGERSEHFLFEFYPDEIMFREDEILGLTITEARALKGEKDKKYLKS